MWRSKDPLHKNVLTFKNSVKSHHKFKYYLLNKYINHIFSLIQAELHMQCIFEFTTTLKTSLTENST